MEDLTERLDALRQTSMYRADLLHAMELGVEVKSCKVLAVVIEQAEAEATAALNALAMVNPADIARILELQCIVYRARMIRATMTELYARGLQAQASWDLSQDEGNDNDD